MSDTRRPEGVIYKVLPVVSLEPGLGVLMEEAYASQVAIYPLHAAGLEDPADVELSRTVTSIGTKGEKDFSSLGRPPGQTMPKGGKGQMEAQAGPVAQANRTAEAAALGFNASAAAETGGIHLGRTNDLGKIFGLVRDDLSCYYVLSYRPPASGDGKRHSLIVDVTGKGLRVRSRPFYIDWTPAESRGRRLETAVAAPGAFRDFDLGIDAFTLGGTRGGRQVLVKTTIPIAALARSVEGLPPPDGDAEVEVLGRLSAKGNEACSFRSAFAVPRAVLAEGGRGSVQVESACTLSPGRYEMTAAVMEARGEAVAGSRGEVVVPAISGFQVGDVQLWAASEHDYVFKEKADAILGPSRGLERGAAAPRIERRLQPGEKGSLFFLVCPGRAAGAQGSEVSVGSPVTVLRAILSAEDPVATFPPLKLTEPPDPRSGCWGVVSTLPDKVFGEGIYTFDYEIDAPSLREPVHGRADFAVGGSAGSTSGP